ncbi:anti-sigma factor antagonist [Actinokineospora sp.]|uniref:anti-sigma factor antagonist n=1 Tax=Actinokineospora sp. TaxID=1872133 RepID=UPI004037A41D
MRNLRIPVQRDRDWGGGSAVDPQQNLVGQASGILADRLVITGDRALDLLRRLSVRTDRELADLARQLVAEHDHPETTPPRPWRLSPATRPRGRDPSVLSSSPAARLRVRLDTGVACVVELSGEIDAATAPDLVTRLLRLPPRDVIVDLSGVSFLGVAGLTMLLRLRGHLIAGGGTLRLAAPTHQVRRLITLAALHDLLPCWPTVAQAVPETLEPEEKRCAP